MLVMLLVIGVAVALGAFGALLTTEKAPQKAPRAKVARTTDPALFIPLEGYEDPSEGFPRGTWVR